MSTLDDIYDLCILRAKYRKWEKMNKREAEEIYKHGPRFDVGVDAQYYISKGFLEGSAQIDEALDFLSQCKWFIPDNQNYLLEKIEQFLREQEKLAPSPHGRGK
jgi:hypothetical protein